MTTYFIGRGVETRNGGELDALDMRHSLPQAVARASELSKQYGGMYLVKESGRGFLAAVWGDLVFTRNSSGPEARKEADHDRDG